MSANVEEWLVSLLSSTHSSIQQLLLQSMDSDLPSLEELVLYQLTQVACISLHHQWTKDSEQASIHVIILKGQLVCVCVLIITLFHIQAISNFIFTFFNDIINCTL